MPTVGWPHLLPPPLGGCAANGGISARLSTASTQYPVAPQGPSGGCLRRGLQPSEHRGRGGCPGGEPGGSPRPGHRDRVRGRCRHPDAMRGGLDQRYAAQPAGRQPGLSSLRRGGRMQRESILFDAAWCIFDSGRPDSLLGSRRHRGAIERRRMHGRRPSGCGGGCRL